VSSKVGSTARPVIKREWPRGSNGKSPKPQNDAKRVTTDMITLDTRVGVNLRSPGTALVHEKLQRALLGYQSLLHPDKKRNGGQQGGGLKKKILMQTSSRPLAIPQELPPRGFSKAWPLDREKKGKTRRLGNQGSPD